MIYPTKPNWCTTAHNCKVLAAKLAALLEVPAPRLSCGEGYLWGQPTFFGCVPKSAGATRPDHRYVFELHYRGDWILVVGETLDAIAAELAAYEPTSAITI